MFKKLIVVNQMSPYDHLVLKFAESLRFLGAEEIVLANHIVSRGEQNSVPYAGSDLEKDLESLKNKGIRTSVLELKDLPMEEINKVVHDDETFGSLILVGAKESSLGKRIFDSEFAYELIQMPTKPIMIVRIHEDDAGNYYSVPMQGMSYHSHVLFPTDFSENAHHAFTYLEKMVEQGLKRVTLMHIQDISKISPYLDYRIIEFNQIDRDRLTALRVRLEELGDVKVEVILEMGRPFREINRVINENEVDLVILGRQGKGIMRDIFIGSNSNNIARRANASVLLIPSEKE
ncbi:universal stress protein [Proteiniclasticum sp.]|uniref:universal stress protein n=1 Tax=Proteiniclasticum sp. TaxID=2053595 RepID=UPI0028A12CEE|nr:universal stress protein [Proteiniclasticum sp.]